MHIFVPFTLHSRSSLVFWLASFFSPACSLRFISWPKTFRCICNSVSLCLVVLCPQSSSLNEASARTMVERSVNVKNTHSMGFNVDNTSQEHLQKEGKKKKKRKNKKKRCTKKERKNILHPTTYEALTTCEEGKQHRNRRGVGGR